MVIKSNMQLLTFLILKRPSIFFLVILPVNNNMLSKTLQDLKSIFLP